MSREPALRFWLHYVEREGGLVEDAGDHAIVLLPPRLREATGYAEEVSVTADPDLAREDGALLLIAGHPELERAAARVLEPGDVGRLHLPWPFAVRPRTSDLQARAREQLDVAHGRIDATGEPRAGYLPLLRVGAMISYSASLTQRFQEQEEVWVDARSALPLRPEVVSRLLATPLREAPQAPQAAPAALEADVPRALAAAHALLEERAAARRAALVTQARPLLERELTQVDAYYAGALDSIARRQVGAPEDRRRMLGDQADATRAEHARRRREIHDEFRAHHEIRPFRLHLVLLPAFEVAVVVRRGARAHAFSLTWLPIAGSFASVRCPHCDAAADLVAGRDRLGCAICLAPAKAEPRAPTSTTPLRSVAPPAKPAPSRPDPLPGTVDPAPAPGPGPSRSSRSAGPLASTRPASRRSARRRRPRPAGGPDLGGGGHEVGPRLALAFWQKLAGGERWADRSVARDSPLGALYRVHGAEGPLRALGVPPGRWPCKADALALPGAPGAPEVVIGTIVAGETSYPYALAWVLEHDRPAPCEITPSLDPAVLNPAAEHGRWEVEAGRRTPASGPRLDPVADALWRHELPAVGLPLTVRCLATHWRVEELVKPGHRAGDLAAAVAGAVARAAGVRRTAAALTAAYGSRPAAVRAVVLELGAALRLDPARGW